MIVVQARNLAELHEVVQAEETARVLDMLGRALVVPDAEALAEAAHERACIQVADASGSAAVGGLVSVPTSDTERAVYRMREAAKRKRAVLNALVSEPDRLRIAAMRRGVGFAARAHCVPRPGHRPDYCAMLTLTYRGGATEWQPRHLSECLKRIRHWLCRRGVDVRYVWVAELQKRGVIHYHVALWLPQGVTIPKPDRRAWWPHGASKVEAARAAVPYLMKYLSKAGELGRLPAGARMHGAGGLDHSYRRARRWLRLPSFVQSRADVFDDWTPARGGGWSDPDGFVIPSEYVRAWVGDGFALVRVHDYGRPFDASGPFTWLARRPEVQ